MKHHRILLCLCLTLFLSCCLLPVSTAADEIRHSIQEDMMGDIIGGPCGSNLTWSFSGGTLTVSGEGEMMFNGTTNYKAPWDSFRADIRCLVIESGITTIRYGAFKDCTALDTVYLSDTITAIENRAFQNCTSLIVLFLPDSLETIGEYAFKDCTSLSAVVFPENLQEIGDFAFQNCALEAAILPDSLQTIGHAAFFRNKLAVLELPDYMYSIGPFAFCDCDQLTYVKIPRGITKIQGDTFIGCTSLATVILPDSITTIEPLAFYGCDSLTSIEIPKKVTTLDKQAFAFCRNLTAVILPESLTTVSEDAFEGCSRLINVFYTGTGAQKESISIDASNEPLRNAQWHTGITRTTYEDQPAICCGDCGGYFSADGITRLNPDSQQPSEGKTIPMHRMYDPNSGEHFYSGSELERDFLVEAGWHYEGVGFNFPAEGAPVHRLYDPVYGEHLYTMDEKEMNRLLNAGWQYEGVAFNSAKTDEVPQYRLHNPNAKRGGYHFTGSLEERNLLISFGWIDQGIGWYSCEE